MSKGKNKKSENDNDTVEVRKATYSREEVDTQEADLAAETLRGDLRDAMLDRFRNTKRPWAAMTETEQREVADQFDAAARHLVQEATRIIAAGGRQTIVATVDSITVKDGIKVVAKVPMTEESLLQLGLAQGHAILIVAASSDQYSGESNPPEIDPDQQDFERADAA